MYTQLATVDAGSLNHIFAIPSLRKKSPCRLLEAVFAAKIGFPFEVELLAILKDDSFLLPFKVLLYALDQFLGAAAGTWKRKAPEMRKKLLNAFPNFQTHTCPAHLHTCSQY